nr:uncharacterized protein LOC128687221 isoform X1 [Cherax quadricarinatus]
MVHKMLARIVSFMLRAVVVVTVFTLGPVLTTQCDLQPPIYECSQLPPLVVEYDNVTLNTCGGLFDKQLFVKQGAVTYTQGDATKTYTVVMVDPDAPRHAEGESYLHWLHSGLQTMLLPRHQQVLGSTGTCFTFTKTQ